MQTTHNDVGEAPSSSSGADVASSNNSLTTGKQHLINLLDTEGEGGAIHWVEPHHREMAIEARLDEFQQQASFPSSSSYAMPSDEWPELSQELANMMDDGGDEHNDDESHYDDLAIDKRRMRGPLP